MPKLDRRSGRLDNRARKVEEKLERLVGKLIPKRVFARPLPEQVKMAEAMMGIAKGGMADIRANLLKDDAMPEDMRDMHKAGKSGEEIKEYYWGCKPFREFWGRMEMDEGMLDILIHDALGK